MLRSLKDFAYQAADKSGFCALAARSAWRQRRLPIICYHGISLADEHLWNPSLFMTAEHFRSRLELLIREEYNVLPLGEALERLEAGTLPRKAVAMTFDDGNHDFFVHAAPALEAFSMPVTVYVTTYYSGFNRPVFNPMLSYLLWKGSGQTLDWPEPLRAGIALDQRGRRAAAKAILDHTRQTDLSGAAKDALLNELASRLGVDYEALCRHRILHRMNQDELRAVSAQGVDLQLHTHRHKTPREYGEFARELEDNRLALSTVKTGKLAHFCYPSGEYYPESGQLLRECGMLSATTCDPGLAAPSTDRYYLPRYCDSTDTTEAVFVAWVSGASALVHSGGQRDVQPHD